MLRNQKHQKWPEAAGDSVRTTIGVFAIAVVVAVSALVLTLIFRGSGASDGGDGSGGSGSEVVNNIQAASAEIQKLTGENLYYDTGKVTFLVSDEVSAASLVVNDTVTFGAPYPAVPREKNYNIDDDDDDKDNDSENDNGFRRATAASSVCTKSCSRARKEQLEMS